MKEEDDDEERKRSAQSNEGEKNITQTHTPFLLTSHLLSSVHRAVLGELCVCVISMSGE